jgi:miniconductance mechanosensitive channel
MIIESIQKWISTNPYIAFAGAILVSYGLYLIARFVIARMVPAVTARTDTDYDDVIVEKINLQRIAWLVPLLFLYIYADSTLGSDSIFTRINLLLIIGMGVFALTSLLNGINDVYEMRPNYSGVSIKGYLDLVKLLFVTVGIILSISIFTGESPVGLLSGLGALTAVLLLIFQDTILSLVASVQIASNDLIKEGDWIEVPSYGADGDVLDMSLHSIKVQNWDKTITVIPTYKMIEVAYKNWRGMSESGGRRIKRSISIDMSSIRFCDREMLSSFSKVNLLQSFLPEKIASLETYLEQHPAGVDSPLDGPQITNVEIFRAYMAAYLRSREDIHQDGLTFLIRSLDPDRHGLPIEVYIFTKTIDWIEYEDIQAEIFEHLVAMIPEFGLRVFQDPTGMDFSEFLHTHKQ